MVDEDTLAFNRILTAFGMPGKTSEEEEFRNKAIEEATLGAIEVPYRVMETALEGFEVIEAMIEKGNPNSISDAGVGALALHTCIEGAWLNVLINASDMKEHPRVVEIRKQGEALLSESGKRAASVRDQVLGTIDQ